jgi:ectoine hydroxylase-related dioxygenase (phytanoyl-CoA dioxygenase family)
MLSPSQIKQYEEQGFVIVDCPFPPSHYEHFMKLVQENVDLTNSDGVRLSNLDPRYTVVDTSKVALSLLEHPDVLAMVSDLFGSDDYRLLMANFNNRTPGIKPMINWHTDYQEGQREEGPRVEVAWYLTPTTQENGCLRVIPGSHRRHATDMRRELALLGREQQKTWRSYEVHHPDEIDIPLGPNKLLLRDGFIWHCTHMNKTNYIRYLYAWSYCPLVETAMLVEYELFLPRHIVESPTPVQRRLFSLDERYRAGLKNRYKQPVTPLRVQLGFEQDRKWRDSSFYRDGEDIRFENP